MNTELNPERKEASSSYFYALNWKSEASAPSSVKEEETPPSQTDKERFKTADAAKERFALEFGPLSFADFKSSHRVTNWVDVITSSQFHLYKKVIKAEYRAALRLTQMIRHDDHVVECFEKLKDKFQGFLRNIQLKHQVKN